MAVGTGTQTSTKASQARQGGFNWGFFKRHRTHTGAKRHPDLLAILSLAFGVAGLLFGTGIAAIVLGHIALRRGERRGYAIGGLVMGYLKLLFWIAYVATFLALFLLFW